MASVEFNKNPATICGVHSQNDIVRPVANFPPSLWGDVFNSFTMDIQLSDMYTEEIKVLKEEARNMLISCESKLSEKLVLVDTLERLGLSYHFENEIQEQLTLAFNGHLKLELEENDDDLFIISLQFRLLRQHALDAPSSVFERFVENNGEFKKSIVSDDDVKGLLSLYEASYLRRTDEEILDKAFSFSKAHLEFVASNLPESPLKKHVSRALYQSYVRGIPRVETHLFISLYKEFELKNESLLRLAKLDFNLLQMQHKLELSEVTRWWKEVDLISKLSFARDRAVECYFWSVGVYSEPQYGIARIMLAKTICMISVIDDTFDAYGTIDELTVFNDAVQKWDISEIDRLPEYMQILYRVLLDLYESFDAELSPKGRSYAVHHAKEGMQQIVGSYYTEAKWFIKGHLPTFDEYMSVAKITSTYYVLTTTSLIGMENATSQVFDWLLSKPKIVEANVTICRVVDDVATYEVEKGRGQEATGIDCYMKEHGLSTEVTIDLFYEMAENAWKELNEGLMDNSVTMEMLMRIYNFARLIDVTYNHSGDGYTHPEKLLKPSIVALLVDSFEV